MKPLRRPLGDHVLWLLVAVLLPIAGLLGGCTNEAILGTDANDRSASKGLAPVVMHGERQLYEIASAVPSFSGLYVDPTGSIHARLTNWNEERALRAALRTVLLARTLLNGREPGVVVELSRFSFLELAAWRDSLERLGFGSIPSLVRIDLDERTGQIHLDVTDPAGVDAVRQLAERIGIPSGASIVEVAPMETDFADSLSSSVHPFLGALQVWSVAAQSRCTIGFNTENGTRFVTASHCTARVGPDGVLARSFDQPLSSGEHLGLEIEDPPTFGSESLPTCPESAKCRWSDAAVIDYSLAGSNTPGIAGLGQLYRTAAVGGFGGGTTLIDGRFTVSADDTPPLMGDTLHKVGSYTGWTKGPVTRTCEDVYSTATGVYFFCQDRVTASAGGGDSGAPVFRVNSDGTVTLFGILRGGFGNVNFDFSSMGNIRADFGRALQTH